MKKRFLDNSWLQVGFKVTKEEKSILKRKAHQNEMTISEFIRTKTLN